MSSIAYITDSKMIEYHRLNGHTSMIFWRPTSQKKFSDFAYGDFLFFLSKDTQKDKEKGIIGYGRYTKEYILSFNQMWNQFDVQTGYSTKEKLHEAILKVAKRNQLPNKLHCLQLENVVFFQVPIYLSELEITISKQVESYIYIDQDDPLISYNIIKKAALYGTDMWTSFVINQTETFEYQADVILIQNIYKQLMEVPYTEYEKRKMMQIKKKYIKESNYRQIARSEDDFMQYKDSHLILYIPCLISLKTGIRNLQFCIGRYELYKAIMMKAASSCTIMLLFDKENPQWEEYLKSLNIEYIINE